MRNTSAGPTRRRAPAMLAIAAPLALAAGCATIVGDEKQVVPIRSSPPGARIAITDEAGRAVYEGHTPADVELPKSTGKYWGGKRFTVQVSKDGYYGRSLTISSRPNAWYLGGNIVFGGVIGWFAVDPWTGRMYTLSPEAIETSLGRIITGAHVVPSAPAASAPSPAPPSAAAPAAPASPSMPPAAASAPAAPPADSPAAAPVAAPAAPPPAN